jgi:soluble lytic murein transglycosylase-like protein
MVRCTLIGLAAAALASPACGQAPDWSNAGGALFVGEAISDPPPPPPITTAAPPFRDEIDAAADGAGLDRKLLRAVVAVESGFHPRAVSPAGAAGLTQLMPGTAAELGVADPFDPAQSLAGGATYLAAQIARFDDLELALAAYNAGPGRVLAAGGAPRIAETRRFVDAVVACVLTLTLGRPVRTAQDCALRRADP